MNIVCTGGHPDDPESGCGGTLARYSALGHAVTILYLTRGEAGIGGKSHEQAAAIRSAECEDACKILSAKPVFAGQIDGSTVVDAKATESFARLLSDERPDIVFAQWPIDTHPTDYVDITDVRERKKTALLAHKSQNGEEIYRRHHEVMEGFRGRESGKVAAEAFVHLARTSGPSRLPGL